MPDEKPIYLINEDSELNKKNKSIINGGRRMLNALTNEAFFTVIASLFDESLQPVCKAVITNVNRKKIKRDGIPEKIADLCAKIGTKELCSGGFNFTEEERQVLDEKKITLYDGSVLIKAQLIANCYKQNGTNCELGIIGGNEEELFCLSRIFNYLNIYMLDINDISGIREKIYRENGTVLVVLPYMSMLKNCSSVLDLRPESVSVESMKFRNTEEFLFNKQLDKITADISYSEYKIATRLASKTGLRIAAFTDYFLQ